MRTAFLMDRNSFIPRHRSICNWTDSGAADFVPDNSSDSNSSDVLIALFDSATKVGTSYFQSQQNTTPQSVPRAVLGTQALTQQQQSGTNVLLWVGLFLGVGYLAFKHA